VFPLSFLLLGLGFTGILVQRERRALHDLIAGSAVVYAWDARAARLRFLAREPGPAARRAPAGRRLPERDATIRGG
jgi:type VI protein secretion system component VasF